MLTSVAESWSTCRAFVATVCKGRPATHGLQHMESVTQQALLLAALEGIVDVSLLRDITIIAMLHDVADHKYDFDGQLESRVKTFLASIALQPEDAASMWAAISAVSYSKEKKKGFRYFESELDPHWTLVRDVVSDADKLLAIGEDGLIRCWAYQHELYEQRQQSGSGNLPPITPASLVADVVQHCHDKLFLLKDKFMVTRAGKFLAEPKQREMETVVAAWAVNPPTTLHYSDGGAFLS